MAATESVVGAAGGRIDWIEAACWSSSSGAVWRSVAGRDARPHSQASCRAQGTVHHAGRQGLSFDQRPPAARTRPVRQRSSGADACQVIRVPYQNVDLVVVRENTEGLYSGQEHVVVPGVVESLRHHHANCRRAHRPLRLRVRPAPGPAASHLLPQGRRAAAQRRACSWRRPARWPTTIRSSEFDEIASRFACACSWRSTRRSSTCW